MALQRIGGGLVLGGLFLALSVSSAAAASSTVVHLELEGVVDPFEASYIASGIDQAEADDASAVVLTIDTPGGLDSSMRKIVRTILSSRIPVLCLVAPPGARAASAGTFILMSCPVAAMAPGTSVGAAHPVGISGAIQNAKVTNDAAAFIRSLAEQRGRNADWAEDAVRKSASISAQKAVSISVVDLAVPSVEALLRKVDGRKVTLDDGRQIQLETGSADVEVRSLGAGASLLHSLVSPDLAFIFFYAGLILIIIELLNPGVSVPGVLGIVLIGLAFSAFGMLPIQAVGVVMLVVSAAFFLLELKHPGVGFPTAGGIAALIVGGILLFDRSVPGASVSPAVIAPVALGAGLFFAFVVQAALRARNLPPAQGSERMLGATGWASTAIAPTGVVQIASETWSGESAVPISKGQRVEVIGVEGLRLKVAPADIDQSPPPSGANLDEQTNIEDRLPATDRTEEAGMTEIDKRETSESSANQKGGKRA